MTYYVVNTDNRRVIEGPFDTRVSADKKHWEICAKGIPNVEAGSVDRPRVAVVNEFALIVCDNGGYYQDERKKAKV